ncbi:MAG: ABC transporter substrate-binding protein [Erysipelotrichaceae bacterium]|nr:ABC transporter substrate-binding protein [Erysipelotrichaceae bacterium]
MKKLWKVLLASAMMLGLAGCSSSSDVEQVMDAQETYGCNVLNVYNWGEYIGENTISNFEKMYNAKVNYSLFDSNEAMYTKLLGGSAYDILIPSDYMIERLIDENLLQPIDKNIVTDFDNLYDGVKGLPYDPDNTYSVPYFWGTVGIVYNKNNVSPEQVEKEGYNILLDEQYKGKVFLYDSERDSFMMAFKALGYSMNTEDQDEIQEAYQWLLDVNKAVDPAYVTDEVIDAMANGEKDIAIMYSGDAAYVLSENEDMAYFTPNSGTNLWSDAMVIPANAKCPGLANEFINYMLSYDAAYDNSYTVGYTSANAQVMEELSEEYDPSAYIPRTGYEKDEVFKHNEVLKKELTDLWIKVKNS